MSWRGWCLVLLLGAAAWQLKAGERSDDIAGKLIALREQGAAGVPRPEYPRPQFVRADWRNLNGDWTCRFDSGKSGFAREWMYSKGFENGIKVPFCPESGLSGIGNTDFIEDMWYHRTVEIPADWGSRKILLHFGGVDYGCEVYVNGKQLLVHRGGSAPFSVELTGEVAPGETVNLVVHVKDEVRSGNQSLGKQSTAYASAGCWYTRVTGIWRTVWLEAVDSAGLRSCRITPDFDGGAFVFTPSYYGTDHENSLKIRISADGGEVASATVPCADGVPVAVKIPSPVAWEPGRPFLYDVLYEVSDKSGKVLDRVAAYAGLRKIQVEGDRIFLNNRPLFLRFALDQGYYPDGIWTAPSDAALKRDIELAMAAGFNGARLHQKVFDERFHYWADKLGYLTWGEFPSWGMGWGTPYNSKEQYSSQRDFTAEWSTVVERDFNHPSIIVWTPFNEGGGHENERRFFAEIYELTRRLDPTRPINDCSGFIHARTDLWTVHNYAQEPAALAEELGRKPIYSAYPDIEERLYCNQPYIIAEYGGVKYVPEGAAAGNAWGYGAAPQDMTEAVSRIRELTGAILALPDCAGYCYTQLYDVEQEQNGIYDYDRAAKFDIEAIRRIFSEKPEWSRY